MAGARPAAPRGLCTSRTPLAKRYSTTAQPAPSSQGVAECCAPAGKRIFAASWTKARLVYEDVPLDQVVADLVRYRKGFLKNDEHAAQLRFTGVLPADDPEAALNIIKNALPVRIERHTIDPAS